MPLDQGYERVDVVVTSTSGFLVCVCSSLDDDDETLGGAPGCGGFIVTQWRYRHAGVGFFPPRLLPMVAMMYSTYVVPLASFVS